MRGGGPAKINFGFFTYLLVVLIPEDKKCIRI